MAGIFHIFFSYQTPQRHASFPFCWQAITFTLPSPLKLQTSWCWERAETWAGGTGWWGWCRFLLVWVLRFFVGVFCCCSLNNTNIHFKESKRAPLCCSSQPLLDFHIPPPPETPVLGASTHPRQQEACPRCMPQSCTPWCWVLGKHLSMVSRGTTQTLKLEGIGTARLSSLMVQLASTACVCLPGHVPKQSDFG